MSLDQAASAFLDGDCDRGHLLHSIVVRGSHARKQREPELWYTCVFVTIWVVTLYQGYVFTDIPTVDILGFYIFGSVPFG